MRVIYLDFDGILMTYRTVFAHTSAFPLDHCYPERNGGKWGKIDPIACEFLHNICKRYDILIVVSSSWRANDKNCYDKLEECNLLEFLHTDWRTDVNTKPRGRQIQDWLDEHPDVKSYRILDDEFCALEKQEPYFVQCDIFDGLGGREMKKLLEWARGETTI